jgi:hypothetical protein
LRISCWKRIDLSRISTNALLISKMSAGMTILSVRINVPGAVYPMDFEKLRQRRRTLSHFIQDDLQPSAGISRRSNHFFVESCPPPVDVAKMAEVIGRIVWRRHRLSA